MQTQSHGCLFSNTQHSREVIFYVLSLPAFVARRLLLVGWVWGVGFEGVSSCCRAVSGTFFASVWKNTAVQKPNVEKVTTVPGRIASAEQTSVILKVAGTLKANVPLGLFQHFQGETLFFWKHDNNSTFNSFPGRCNTLSFFYLKGQFRYHFCDSLTRNGKNGTAGTDTEHLGRGGLVEDCVTCVAPHLLVKTCLASRTYTNTELPCLAARPELATSL